MTVSYPIKIEQPAIANALLRHRLFVKVDAMRANQIFWVAGPGGAGKTTLLSSYITYQDIPCIWYRVDSSDNDPASFFHYLSLATHKAAPEKRVNLPHFTPEYHLGIEDFSRYYFSELYNLLQPGSCLVFDNCHEIDDTADFFRIILAGLTRMHPGMNLIFISRREPPVAFRHYAVNGKIGRLDWPDLRLNIDEFLNLADTYGLKQEKDNIIHLHSLLDGWVAGLQLLCRTGWLTSPIALSPEQMEEQSREILFDYFASEAFQNLDPQCQDVLTQTSILPYIDEETIAVVCDAPHAFDILKKIYRANIFIHRHGNSRSIYRYHTLFREFLLDRCHRKLPKKTINALYRNSADKLLERGQIEEAAALLIESRHWRKLSQLILAEAPKLLQQGRFITLGDWLDHLPENEKQMQPWLVYWRGMSLMFQQPPSAWQQFRRALSAFERIGDIVGIFQAISGMGESLGYGFDSYLFYDHWLNKLEQLTATTDFPNITIEARIYSILISAIAIRTPSHPKTGEWLTRARYLLEHSNLGDSFLQIQLLNPLILYYISTGNLSEAALLVESFKAIADKPGMPPLHVILMKNSEALYYWRIGLTHRCKSAVEEALSLSRQTGIHVFNAILLINGASGALCDGDNTRAQIFLEKLEKQYAFKGSYIRQLYHVLKSWKNLLENLASQSVAHARQAIQHGNESGNPEATAGSHLVLAMAHHLAGRSKEGLIEGQKALEISRRNQCRQMEFACLMFLAESMLDDRWENLRFQKLEEALSIGAEHGYFCFPLWRTDAVVKLCRLALQKNIQTAYVKKLVEQRGLSRSNPPMTVKDWPWSLRIYCFGRFALVSNEQPLTLGGKAQQKPLTLLKLLLCRGGRNVSVASLTNTLWPDADGDMQMQTFNTTLHRLRRLLGVKKAIKLQAGEVTLDNRSCWVDVWAFERLVKDLEPFCLDSKKKLPETSAIVEAIKLYHGPFLASEEAGWAVTKREILHDKFVNLIQCLGQKYMGEGKWTEAIACFRKGLESAPS